MIHRGGSVGFEHVPVDGSSKMPDDLMESVEPYDYSDAVDFQTAYLAGYLADKYDVTAEESIDRANRARQALHGGCLCLDGSGLCNGQCREQLGVSSMAERQSMRSIPCGC